MMNTMLSLKLLPEVTHIIFSHISLIKENPKATSQFTRVGLGVYLLQ